VLELALTRRLDIRERNFLMLLIAHQRWKEIGDIASLYAEIKRAAASETECEVTTAMAVDEAEKTKWSVGFAKKLGRRVHLVFRVDPALIGGAQIRIGDRVWDGSVRGHLVLLSRALTRPLQYSRG
jgi:F-type H+-transporting ATPase subunit delta